MNNKSIFDFDRMTTSNGISVYYKSMKPNSEKDDFVWCAIMVRAGSHYQGDKKGLAHFFEHLVFANNDEKFVSNILDNIDFFIESNVYTNDEFIVFYAKVKTKNISVFLYILRNAFVSFNITEKTMKDSVNIIKNEIFKTELQLKLSEFGSFYFVNNITKENFNKNHLFDFNRTGGIVRDIEMVSLADMKKYWEDYFHIGNVSFIFVGNIEKEDCIRNVENFFWDMEPRSLINKVEEMKDISYVLKEKEILMDKDYVIKMKYFSESELEKAYLEDVSYIEISTIVSIKYKYIANLIFYYLKERIFYRLREELGIIYKISNESVVSTVGITYFMRMKNVIQHYDIIKKIFLEEFMKLKSNIKKILYDEEDFDSNDKYDENTCQDVFDVGVDRIKLFDSTDVDSFYLDVNYDNIENFLEKEFTIDRILLVALK